MNIPSPTSSPPSYTRVRGASDSENASNDSESEQNHKVRRVFTDSLTITPLPQADQFFIYRSDTTGQEYKITVKRNGTVLALTEARKYESFLKKLEKSTTNPFESLAPGSSVTLEIEADKDKKLTKIAIKLPDNTRLLETKELESLQKDYERALGITASKISKDEGKKERVTPSDDDVQDVETEQTVDDIDDDTAVPAVDSNLTPKSRRASPQIGIVEIDPDE